MGAEAIRAALTTSYVKKMLRVKARQLVRRPGFSRSEEWDIRQDLAAHVLAKARLYDPARASVHTFISRIVDSAVAMILRTRRRLKRAAGFRAESLEGTVIEGNREETSLGETLEEGSPRQGAGSWEEADPGHHDDQVDVAGVLATFPPDLREVALRLADGTEASIAQEMGISRRRVRKTISDIRKRFERAGLKEF
jgi:DNA-directed RNA polymerase specialized sigma24 family protein